MKAASLSAEITGSLRELAWGLWSQLGVSAARPAEVEQRAIDPEALLLFTLEIGRDDPRLLDETLDWLVTNEQLVSVQRLRNLARQETDRALVDATLSWTAQSRPRTRARVDVVDPRPGDLTPFFRLGTGAIGTLDPAFAQHGFARPMLQPSGKSQPPDLQAPIAFAFRLRRLLGQGVRAEIVRTLLTVRAPYVSGRVLAEDAAFASRNVRDGVLQLHDAGVLTTSTVRGERRHALAAGQWAELLGLGASDLPLHFDWIPALRALTAIVRWLHQPGLDDRSDYLLASQARTLFDEIEPDLRFTGVPLPRSFAGGEAFWDDLVAIARRAVQHVGGIDRSPG